jgi:leucyl aminopeptidase
MAQPKLKKLVKVSANRKSKNEQKKSSPARGAAKNKTEASPNSPLGIYGFTRDLGVLSHVEQASLKFPPPKDCKIDGECHIFGQAAVGYEKKELEILKDSLEPWQMPLVNNHAVDLLVLQTRRAPVWILRPRNQQDMKSSKSTKSKSHHYGLLEVSPYAQMRDRLGGLWPSLKDTSSLRHLGLFFHNCSGEEIQGALVGLEMASYRFNHLVKGKPLHPTFKITIFGASQKQIQSAKKIGESVNLARHLVNLDAAKINPASYSEFVMKWFKDHPNVSVDVWGPERLLKENMQLHYGVGQAAVERSHMVHIKYRPPGKARLTRPIAFVGKGVTFDTGGLDLKPASGMRYMKKDMGGSASVVGIAHWLAESTSDVACDLYLALAENSVDAHSFRPGDVLTARNGLTVEIHNTDAEGRLVMADVMDVATGQSADMAPAALIDLSTLTGAMRVAVGTELAGMFANHDGLADLALSSGQQAGDRAWRIPLWDNYKAQLKSTFADLSNASESGFGGAITAALFLQRFVKYQIPWLHFDMYCWSDRSNGVIQDSGGNGQGVQMMVRLLEQISQGTLRS